MDDKYKSEILFLLVGNNPLPNYVAAKLLAKPFGETPALCLIYSHDTEKYAHNLVKVLGKDNFTFHSGKVEPWDYSSIKREVGEGVKAIKKFAEQNSGNSFSVGLNYTGGTKAMAVHAYRAIKELENDGIKTQFSYLDSDKKWMRIDVEDGGQEVHSDLSDARGPDFEQTKISLDELLRLHGWEKFSQPVAGVKFSDVELNATNLPNFTPEMFEHYILKTVISLKEECGLGDVFANLEIANPYTEAKEKYCEIDVVAIRGYQLFAISSTIAKTDEVEIRGLKCSGCGKEIEATQARRLEGDVKHILTHKLFEVAHRAKQLGGAESRIGLACRADAQRTKNLRDKLKNDKIEVFGKDDLPHLRTKLQRWFNQK